MQDVIIGGNLSEGLSEPPSPFSLSLHIFATLCEPIIISKSERFLKQAKNPDTSPKDIQMVKKHTDRCSIAIVSKEI